MNELGSSLSRLIDGYVFPLGWKLLGAIAIWVVGGWAIGVLGKALGAAMTRRNVEPTLGRYSQSTVNVVLRIVLVIVILSAVGIETTSFAALLAAAGIAIGAAWAGLLANFAAGVFLVLLRPFKVGDFVTVGGVTGTVREIGLFGTVIDQPDNVRALVGNNKIFSDVVVNYQANAYRRVDLAAQLAHGVEPRQAIALIRARLAQLPNVLPTPAPDVEILEFNPAGTKLVVRPYCANQHYWQVYFDTNKALLDVGSQAGWPIPAPQQVVYQAGPRAPDGGVSPARNAAIG
jgi:small conductance mechanosensitive channel